MNARATARAHSREERRARSGARVPPMPACAARGMVQRVKISPPSQGLMSILQRLQRSARGSARLGTRLGTGVAAVGAGRVSRSRDTSERAAFGARGTRTRDATMSAALPRRLDQRAAANFEVPEVVHTIGAGDRSAAPCCCHRFSASAVRRRAQRGHRGMGCVLSSERSADDFGADSRTMLARPKVRVASPPPDGRSLGTRHVTAGAFSPTRLFVAFRAARLAPPRPERARIASSSNAVPSGTRHPLFVDPDRSRSLPVALALQPRVLGVIPARYNSRRFAGKPLALLAGKPLVMHVYRNACKAKCLDACVVATDDDRIAKAVRDNGGEVIMTDAACETSPERCLEVVRKLRRRRADGKKDDDVDRGGGRVQRRRLHRRRRAFRPAAPHRDRGGPGRQLGRRGGDAGPTRSTRRTSRARRRSRL